MDTTPSDSSEGSLGPEGADSLDAALSAGQFFLVYQPTIDLQTGAFAGVEALIRWRHPQLGVLSPDAFIHALEKSDQILPVGRWALTTACVQGAAWHDKGYRFAVSVNMAKRQLDSAELRDDVADALSVSRFDPALLVLEFAQSFLLDDAVAASAQLGALKGLGVRLAVDDFEPRESTLDELADFNIDIVKLSRGFVSEISASEQAAALLHNLVQLSERHHVQVIAAGIEDSDQRDRLQGEMVHVGQGFLFSKPHEAKEIDHFLEDFAIFSGKPL